MKPNLLLLITLTITSLVFADEAKKADPNKAVYGGVTIKENSTLSKLISLPSVAPQYEACKAKVKLEKISDCIWNGDSSGIPPLSQSQKDEVQKMYAQEEAKTASSPKIEVDAKASAVDVTANDVRPTTNLTNRSATIGTDYSSDPAVKALSAFFGKKLDEVFNGTTEDKKADKIMIVEHDKFIDLYTSELGKSIVNAFTSYCMETDPKSVDAIFSNDLYTKGLKEPLTEAEKVERAKIIKNGYIITKEKRKQNIDSNKKSLDSGDLSTGSVDGQRWLLCIPTVADICYATVDKSTKSLPVPADQEYSKQKACLVMDFVKSARKNLILAEQQKKFYDGLAKGVTIDSDKMKEMNQKDASSDKLTQITSADIVKDAKSADEKTVKEIDDCIAEVNNEKCKKILDTNTNNNTEALAELGLKQQAQEAELVKKLGDDKNVSSYLKEEGYTNDQIKDLTSADKIEDVRNKIKARITAENQAIIKEMAERISAKTTAQNGKIDGANKTDTSALGNIRSELAGRNEDLKNLIHFNNIVASYLTLKEGNSEKKTRNTASLFAEVNSMDKKDSAEILLKIKQNKDLQDNQTTADLKVDTINELLKYTEDPKATNP